MRRSRLLVILLAASLGACGGDASGGGDYDGGGDDDLVPCDAGGTRLIAVDPYRVARGADLEINITWQTYYPVSGPRATLDVDDGEIQVELDLAYDDLDSEATHVGSLTNPFGFGAPAGTVKVLVRGDSQPDCDYWPTATTTFSLE